MKKQILSLIILATVAVMATAQPQTMRAFTAGGNTTGASYGVFGQPFAAIEMGTYEVSAGVAQMQLVRDTAVVLLSYGSDYAWIGEDFSKNYTNLTRDTIDSIYIVNGGVYNYDVVHYLYIIVCADSVLDYDGLSKYGVIAMNGYCWTKENLRSINGDPMTYNSEQHPAAQVEANLVKYGYLYTWTNATTSPGSDNDGHVQGICPNGWHIPDATEIDVVYSQDVTTIRTTTDWNTTETNTNSTRFSAYPAGEFSAAANRFQGMGSQTDWWSTTTAGESKAVSLQVNYYCNVPMYKERNVEDGLSVRCVMIPDVPEDVQPYWPYREYTR